MKRLAEKYSSRGFVIVCTPSNQFGGQEPDTPAEIVKFVKDEFDLTPLNSKGEGTPGFYMMEKMHVNGEDTHPLWVYLKSYFPGKVGWNFGTHFFVWKTGIPAQRCNMRGWKDIGEIIEQLMITSEAAT